MRTSPRRRRSTPAARLRRRGGEARGGALAALAGLEREHALGVAPVLDPRGAAAAVDDHAAGAGAQLAVPVADDVYGAGLVRAAVGARLVGGLGRQEGAGFVLR